MNHERTPPTPAPSLVPPYLRQGIPYIGGEHFPLPPMDSMDAMSQLQVREGVCTVSAPVMTLGRCRPPLISPMLQPLSAHPRLSHAPAQIDPDIGAVVVGWDPHFSYSRLVYASIALRELPGPVPLVVTNTDCADHIGGGRMMPGTGGLAAALEVASGRKAVRTLRLVRTFGMFAIRIPLSGRDDGPGRA